MDCYNLTILPTCNDKEAIVICKDEESKDESSSTTAVTISLGVVAAVLILCLVALLLYHMHKRRVAGRFHVRMHNWQNGMNCANHTLWD